MVHGSDHRYRRQLMTEIDGEHEIFQPLTDLDMFKVFPTLSASQHIAGLSLRAGLHPVLVGGAGSGKRSLMRHALACTRVHDQIRWDSFTSHSVSQEVLRGLWQGP